MSYLYEVPNLSNGFDSAMVDLASTVPVFVPMLLLFVYMMVLMGGMSSQKRRTGFADMPMWGTLAGLCCFLIALSLSLVDGLMNITILGIVIAITLVFAVWLFLDRRSTEM